MCQRGMRCCKLSSSLYIESESKKVFQTAQHLNSTSKFLIPAQIFELHAYVAWLQALGKLNCVDRGKTSLPLFCGHNIIPDIPDKIPPIRNSLTSPWWLCL